MKRLATLISIFSHPIGIPLVAVVVYFNLFPVYYETPIIVAKTLATCILTIFIPVIFLFILKSFRLISSFRLPSAKERKLPLLFCLLIDLVIINYIFDIYEFRHLFFFFWALLLSGIITFLGLIFRFKVSLHSLGLSSLTFFISYLSYDFSINLVNLIALLVLLTGIVSTSRLYLKAHSVSEIVLGCFLGFSTQLLIPLYFDYL